MFRDVLLCGGLQPNGLGSHNFLWVDSGGRCISLANAKIVCDIRVGRTQVFCGLWRLGCETTIELLHETPDISWYLPSLQTHVAKVVGRVSFKTRTKMHFLGDTFKKQAYSRD